jgi:hypothetical protein
LNFPANLFLAIILFLKERKPTRCFGWATLLLVSYY